MLVEYLDVAGWLIIWTWPVGVVDTLTYVTCN